MPNLALVKAFMQVEGQLNLTSTTENYNKKGGAMFAGYDKDGKHVQIVMDKYQVELINECQGVLEVYECYKDMGYF